MSGTTSSDETLANGEADSAPRGGGFAQGDRLDRYLVLRRVGSGGMGVVYVAFDPELDRQIAIKVLHPFKASGGAADAQARLLREAQSMAKLAHPNVVPVYDVGAVSSHAEDGVFIAMEFVVGTSLSTWLSKRQRSWREIIEVFLQAGEGLAAAHRGGLVHRDFKPENVMVGDDGRARVMDFGLARDRDVQEPSPGLDAAAEADQFISGRGADSTNLTRTGAIMGTPAYMSPEQHLGEVVDARSDQFSFCVALWEALFRQRPFRGESLHSLALQVTQGNLQPPPRGTPVPGRVIAALSRGLAVTADARFSSMRELLGQLAYDPALRWRRVASVLAAVSTLAALGVGAAYYLEPGVVTVHVQSASGSPLGASVSVDGALVAAEKGVASVETRAGLHRIEVGAPGFAAEDAVVEVTRAGTHELTMVLRHLKGTMELEVQPPGGSVLVDGVDYGSRLTNFEVDTGEHQLWVRKEGHHDVRMAWTVDEGERTAGSAFLAPAVSWSHDNPFGRSYPQAIDDVDGDGQRDLLRRLDNEIVVEALGQAGAGGEFFAAIFRAPVPVMVTAADVDGDTRPELVVAGYLEDRAKLLVTRPVMGDHANREREWELSFSEDAPPPLVEPLAVSGPEGVSVVAVAGRELVSARAEDGRLRWKRRLSSDSLAVARLDADRIAVVYETGIAAFNVDTGEPEWAVDRAVGDAGDASRGAGRGIVDWTMANASWAAVANLDATPGADLVLPVRHGEHYQLIALAGADGSLLWEGPDVALSPFDSVAHVGDVDADGRDELLRFAPGEPSTALVIGGREGKVRFGRPATDFARFAAAGGSKWFADTRDGALILASATTGEAAVELEVDGVATSLSSANWDTDGSEDLVVGTSKGSLIGFDEHLDRLGSALLGGRVNTVHPAGDLNSDGVPDFVVGSFGAKVVLGRKTRWSRRYLGPVRVGPIIADFDADDQLEVAVFGRTSELVSLQLLDAETGGVQQQWDDGADPVRPPALLETPDGRSELVAMGGWQKNLWVYDMRAPDLAPRAIDFPETYSGPSVGDVDGDGIPEVVAVGWHSDPQVTLFDSRTWTRRWTQATSTASFGSQVHQLDGGGPAEVVVSLDDGTVAVLEGDTGTMRWSVALHRPLQWPVQIADVDADGAPEIVSSVHLPDTDSFDLVGFAGSDGAEVWRIEGVGHSADVVVADVDGDNALEIISPDYQRGLVAVELDGSVLWEMPGYREHLRLAPLTIADLDGDGALELIESLYAGGFNVRRASDGSLLWRYHADLIESPPVAADVDGDGQKELIFGTQARLLQCVETRMLPTD